MAAQPLGRFTRGKMQILDPSTQSSRAGGLSVAQAQQVLNRALLVAQVELSTCVAHALAVLFILNPRGRVETFCSANSLSYRLR